MKTIWKTEIQITDRQIVLMPEGSKPLCAAVQNDVPQMWWEVNTAMERAPHRIDIVGTGQALPDIPNKCMRIYICTILAGSTVFHVYHIKDTD